MSFVDPGALLTAHSCAACGRTYLTAKVDATSNLEPAHPLRIAPVLLAPEHIAHAIIHNLRLYKISATGRGPVAGEWHYTQPARFQATRETSRPKYAGLLGIAPEHIHHSDPPGERIHVPDREKPAPDPRLELLHVKRQQFPHLADILTDILDPPPF